MAKKKTSKLKAFFAKRWAKPVTAIVAIIVLIGVFTGIIILESTPSKISIHKAQQVIDRTYSQLKRGIRTQSGNYIVLNSKATVKSLSYGSNKEIHAKCEVSTINTYDVINSHLEDLYSFKTVGNNNLPIVSTKLKYLFDNEVYNYLKKESKRKTITYKITICETPDGLRVYTSEKMINKCFGNLYKLEKKIHNDKTLNINGKDVSKETNLRNGIISSFSINYSTERPETATGLLKLLLFLKTEFYRNFVNDNLWKYITSGLLITIEVSCLAVLIGISLGFINAIVRCTYDKTGKLYILNKIAKAYLTVFRGTPVVVQLMIIYFVCFMPLGINKVLAAIICFGLNSGAYVCEIVRGGIMSIDEGQMEAGRSLGFNYVQTMWHIIIPQAFKAVLPALANEFIVLLKETSVVGYIGLNDLTRGGDIIKSITYSAFMPLIIVAIIYLVIVMILTRLVGLLERRLRNSER